MGPSLSVVHTARAAVYALTRTSTAQANVRNMKFNQRVRLARGLSHLLSGSVGPLAAHQRNFGRWVV